MLEIGRSLKLPNINNVLIPKAKITGYLLSESHPHGRHKAAVFGSFGFTARSLERLASALRRHAIEQNVAKIEDTPFGTRYIIEGGLVVPNGGTVALRSIWFVEKGEHIPRFVTAYPLEREDR